MCCPCRLAAEDREQDKDIICPCVYRAADVAEFGSCYCNLYVSREWNAAAIPHVYVPERRPLEKRFPGVCASHRRPEASSAFSPGLSPAYGYPRQGDDQTL